MTLDRVLPVGCWTPGFIAGPPADGQEPRRHSFGEILRPGRPERRETVKPFEDAHSHRVLEDPGRLIGCHGLQVRLLSTRRGPVQSGNLKGVTSGTGPGYTLVIKLSCRMSCRPSVACLHLCVVGSHAWTPRVGGAMCVGLEASHVSSRRSGPSVSPSVMSCPVCGVPGSPILEARSAFWARVGPAACDQHSFIGGSRGAPTGRGGGQDERSCLCLAECLLACLPACLPACLLTCLT